MADPVGVCVAFDDDALEPDPTWTRLDDPAGYNLVTRWTVDRGRDSEFDRVNTGTATISLIDTHGVVDPTNTGGPFFGKLDPMKQAAIAVRNPVAGTWTTIFRGFVSEWLYDWDVDEPNVLRVTLELADAFDLIAALELTPEQHGQTTGLDAFADVWYEGTPSNVPGVANAFKHVDDRIQDILDDVGWPAGLRDIFSGNCSVQGAVYARRNQALQALQDAADAEFPTIGSVHMSKANTFRFRGRFARYNPTHAGYGIGHWYAGDATAVSGSTAIAPISGLSMRRSKQDIYNAVLALPQGVDETDVPSALVKDNTSIGTFGWRGLSFNDLLVSAGHDDDNNPTTAIQEAVKYSTTIVENYKSPKTRATRIVLKSRAPGTRNAAALWETMVGAELSDLLTLTTTHPGGGGFTAIDFYMDGLRYSADVTSGTTAYAQITLEADLTPRGYYSGTALGSVDDGV